MTAADSVHEAVNEEGVMLHFAIGGAGTFCAVVMGCWVVACASALYWVRAEER